MNDILRLLKNGLALLRERKFEEFFRNVGFFLRMRVRPRQILKQRGKLRKGLFVQHESGKEKFDLVENELVQESISQLSPDAQQIGPRTPVAVIIPIFNESRFLAAAVGSALMQTHNNTRIYIVDDGSTEDVFAQLPDFIREDKRVKYYRHSQNLGLPAARNTGLLVATEPLVQFLDADDLLSPWSISRRIKMLSEIDLAKGIAGAATGVVQVSSEMAHRALAQLKDKPGPPTLIDYLNFNFSVPFNVHQPLLLRSKLLEAGGFDETFTQGGEDAELWGRMILSGHSFLLDKANIGAVYRQVPGISMVQLDPLSHSRVILDLIYKWGSYSQAISSGQINFEISKRIAMSAGLQYAKAPLSEKAKVLANVTLAIPGSRRAELTGAFLSAFRRGLGFGPLELGLEMRSRELRPLISAFLSRIILSDAVLQESPKTLESKIAERGASYETNPELPAEPVRAKYDFEYCHLEEKAIDSTSSRALSDLKNKYLGETCVLIGNGPSLRLSSPDQISRFPAFGVNSIFLADDDLRKAVTFLTVEDTAVIKENASEIASFQSPQLRFFPVEYRRFIGNPERESDVFFRLNAGFYGRETPSKGVPRFSKDPRLRLFSGQSVTFINLQLAYWMDLKRVALVGMDFEYKIPESSIVRGVMITSQEADPNHFHPDYFGPGKTWKDPKLDMVEKAYGLAKRVFENDGREIINCTVGGKLEVFQRADLESL